jgi:oxygen-independent coproporphyrinogen-3 oxidase
MRDVDAYIDALIAEINAFETKATVGSIFMGGGTPSCIESHYIGRIAEKIYSRFKVAENAEFTIEANPCTLSLDKLKAYRSYGINRLSVGVQAWQDNLLKRLGRVHTAEQAEKSINAAKEAGFDNINIDLMFSLPEQSFEKWRTTLEKTVSIEPTHISAYSLIVEEGTPFYDMELKLPSEDTDRRMYHYAVEYLRDNGYYQYEISNFARKGLACRHNLVYWDRGEYKGFGLNAASLIGKTRLKNTESFDEYLSGVTVSEREELTCEDEMSEFMFLGLRKTEGISVKQFKGIFNADVYKIFGNSISKHIKDGLLLEDNGFIRLTTKGLDLANIVFEDMLL